MVRVLVTDAEYADLGIEESVLTSAGHELLRASCRTEDDVIAAAAGMDAVLVQYAPVTARVLEGVPSVRLVSRYGVGVDTVDLAAARSRGVWVCNVPDYGTSEVALHAVALLLALLRNLPGHDREVKAGGWSYRLGGELHRPSTLMLGVVGLGRIGRMTLERAAPWFGSCVAYDPFLPDSAWPSGVERVELAEVFARSNAVTLHLPLTEETRGLVDARALASMPHPSYLVNTARGGLVNVDAVADALESGQLAGAGLDVLPQEPPEPGHPVLVHPRAIVTPHVGWYSEEAEIELRRKAAANVVEWARTGRPPYAVVEGR